MTNSNSTARENVRVKTPCIGVCSTGIGGNVCRGCKRFGHEVVQWNGYSEAEKSAVMKRLSSLLAQVVRERVDVFDVDLLADTLSKQKIRYHAQADPYAWVFDLLAAGASQIDDLAPFGCRMKESNPHANLRQLRDDIDHDFFVLSSAHYDKYFNRV